MLKKAAVLILFGVFFVGANQIVSQVLSLFVPPATEQGYRVVRVPVTPQLDTGGLTNADWYHAQEITRQQNYQTFLNDPNHSIRNFQ
jgi:hypothetical protein